MSFLAKLFINDEERNILNANQVFSRFADINGRPTAKPYGSLLNFSIESTRDDSFFYENMLSPTNKIKGEIVFYKRDALSKLFKMEFANAQILSLSEEFNAVGNIPLHLNISIGWGIMKMRDVIHQETWNPDNPFIHIEETIKEEEEEKEPKLIEYYLTDANNKRIEKGTKNKIGDIICLNIHTKNLEGEVINISLNNNKADYKYNGEVLTNDTFKNYTINSDHEKVELEIVKQEK